MLLRGGEIYPISNSKWVSPVQVVPKKGSMMIAPNDKGENVAMRRVARWRICTDYWKLNKATEKTIFHCHLLIMCWRDWQAFTFFSILIVIQDFSKALFIPRTKKWLHSHAPMALLPIEGRLLVFKKAPATFQRCMMAIFSQFIKNIMEIFMHDFSIYRSSFVSYLANLEISIDTRKWTWF